MHVSNAVALAAGRRRAFVVRVSGTSKQLIECQESALMLAGDMLGVDLLQAQYVGIEPFEGGPQHIRAQFKRYFGLRR